MMKQEKLVLTSFLKPTRRKATHGKPPVTILPFVLLQHSEFDLRG
jgi:hypothetical protein